MKNEKLKCSLSKDIIYLVEGGTDDDILEIFSNLNCIQVARNSKERKVLLTEVAHKELIQTLRYIPETFDIVFLYTKFIKDVNEMEQNYNQLVPSCKKVLKIFKPDI